MYNHALKALAKTDKLQNSSNNNYSYSNFIDLFAAKRSFLPLTGCVLEHILHSKNLSESEKLFYLIADSLSLISSKNVTHQRSVALSSSGWSRKLSCSKSEIFTMQKSLEEKGYFTIIRDKNKFGKNQRNIIIPTLPDQVFSVLAESPDRFNFKNDKDLLSDIADQSTKRAYLDKSKLFIRLNYQLLLLVTSSFLSSFAKIIWLDFYVKGYKSSMKSKHQHTNVNKGNSIESQNNPFSFNSTYQELEDLYLCSKSSLSKALKELEQGGLLYKTRSYVKNDNQDDNLHDKSLWNFIISIPSDGQDIMFDEGVSDNMKIDSSKTLESTKNIVNDHEHQASQCTISKYDPYISKFRPLLNKDLILNNKDLKNLDSNFPFLKNVGKSESDLSEFCINSLRKVEIDNKSVTAKQAVYANNKLIDKVRGESRGVNNKNTTKQIFTSVKSLESFHPLSKEQVYKLNHLSGREFNVNFTNQLLLKLHNVNPDKKFLSQNHMMSYMSKALHHEKHQGPLVNHESFRFASNLNDKESDGRTIEKYLAEVEYNVDTSYQSQLRRKIAAQLQPKLAYQILKAGKFDFKTEDSFIIQLPDKLSLTDKQQEILENSVYSNCVTIGYAQRGESVMPDKEKGEVVIKEIRQVDKIVNPRRQHISQDLSLDLEEEQVDQNNEWYKKARIIW